MTKPACKLKGIKKLKVSENLSNEAREILKSTKYTFKGKKVYIDVHHLTTKCPLNKKCKPSQRILDIKRARMVPYIESMLLANSGCEKLLSWYNPRIESHSIWCTNYNYLIVLKNKKDGNYAIKTAHIVKDPKKIAMLYRAYRACKNLTDY